MEAERRGRAAKGHGDSRRSPALHRQRQEGQPATQDSLSVAATACVCGCGADGVLGVGSALSTAESHESRPCLPGMCDPRCCCLEVGFGLRGVSIGERRAWVLGQTMQACASAAVSRHRRNSAGVLLIITVIIDNNNNNRRTTMC
eukprot:3120892-Rhodomonas_salina.4